MLARGFAPHVDVVRLDMLVRHCDDGDFRLLGLDAQFRSEQRFDILRLSRVQREILLDIFELFLVGREQN